MLQIVFLPFLNIDRNLLWYNLYNVYLFDTENLVLRYLSGQVSYILVTLNVSMTNTKKTGKMVLVTPPHHPTHHPPPKKEKEKGHCMVTRNMFGLCPHPNLCQHFLYLIDFSLSSKFSYLLMCR